MGGSPGLHLIMVTDPFPNMADWNHFPESDASEEYNCVAWSLHSQRHYIWPDEREQFSWPDGLPREDTINGLKRLFTTVGFSECISDVPEAGFEKIAIYANSDGPQHVARLRPDGRWTSKLGEGTDEWHADLNVLAGGVYGSVVAVMKRAWAGQPPKLPRLHPPPARLVTPRGGPLVP
jgi:hypothetical protein